MSALPGDPTFNQINDSFDEPSYRRICAEFGIAPNTDFRYTRGDNNGLGSVFVWITNSGIVKARSSYPGYDKFSDEEGSASKGN